MDSARATIEELKIKISQANLPTEVSEKLLNLLKITVASSELDSLMTYVDFVLSLPFGKYTEEILDINRAKQILDKNHYGLESVKSRILEYLSVLILHKQTGQTNNFHAPILAFIGLVGTGKTSLAYSIAESLGRPLARIPFGGLGDPTILRGQSRHDIDAEPGQIIKAIKLAKVSNPVILLDEIDRVAVEHRVDIMGVLVELLDLSQNQSFLDHYLDFPYDLSQVLFIATANNTGNIATAVLDRLEPIMMPSYSDEEKLIIGKNYLLPKALEEAGINKNVLIIDDSTWPQILRPLGFDSGIRSLSRSLQNICRKVARKVVEGSIGPFKITGENLSDYLSS
ncbi:AAA family ATPase [Candidatus Gottesmanbacteria bacterium]|nr:AAA family ATPase [Candidatus Gottesmanbacteria bacterium]